MKNARYQVVGGSSPLVMGIYVIDPFLLKASGITQEHWRIEDYASDLMVLRLASTVSVQKLVQLETSDKGNVVVLVLTLYFIRLRLYAVNAKKCHI